MPITARYIVNSCPNIVFGEEQDIYHKDTEGSEDAILTKSPRDSLEPQA